MFRAYARYFDFNGRAARSEFWLFVLWCAIASSVAMVVDYGALGWSEHAGEHGMYGPITDLVILFNLIPSISVTVRRLHDKDKSGWLYFLSLIPIVGAIILLIWFCQAGTLGANRFGDPVGSTGATRSDVGRTASGADGDVLQKLEQLGRLRDQGVLTEAEFAAQKAAALGGAA